MYKVIFTDKDSQSVVYAQDFPLEQSVQLALSLHQASNIEHLVGVYCQSDDSCVCLLRRVPESK